MTKCIRPSCLEPAFQEGLCEGHFEHEQRIRAVEARIEAQLATYGDKGGVLRTPQSLMPPETKKRHTPPNKPSRRDPTQVEEKSKRVVPPDLQAPACQVTFCGAPQDDLGLCLACKSCFLLWRRYHLVGRASPMTPSPQQVVVFQRLQSDLGSPRSTSSPAKPPRHS